MYSAYKLNKQGDNIQLWWITSWNQDCWKKYQQPQICRGYHSNGRKRRGTKEPLDKGEGGEWKSLLKTKYLKKTEIMGSTPFSSVQLLSRVWLFVTPWIAPRQASLSITNSWSSLKLISIESVMPSSHLILCHPLLLQPQIPPSIRVFSNESTQL